jgi:copper chaperone
MIGSDERDETMEKATIEVQGMTCGGCVASVTRVLKALPGVGDVDVTLSPGRATITYDAGRTDVKAMERAIEDAGYDVA